MSEHVGALAHRQRRDRGRADRHVVDAQQRRAAAGQAEQPLEADGEVEVAARVQAALGERLDAVEARPRAARSQVWASVPMVTSGLRRRQPAPHARAVLGAADLPGAADVAEPDVPGRVEARPAPEVALRQGAERRSTSAAVSLLTRGHDCWNATSVGIVRG